VNIVEFPESLLYTESHEWVKVENSTLPGEGSQVSIVDRLCPKPAEGYRLCRTSEVGSEFKKGRASEW